MSSSRGGGNNRGSSSRGGGQRGAGGGGGGKRREDSPEVQFSKTLTYLLRHGAEKEGLHMRPDGFVLVSEILNLRKLKGKTEQDVRKTVETDDKQRFAFSEEDGVLYIRANQGHSIEVKDLALKRIESHTEIPKAVHGTYHKFWPSIQKEGLKKMGRNHIHLSIGEYGSKEVISGMRSSAQILIYIDIEQAMKDGIEFFLSDNKVVLSNGIDGVIAPKYFKSVVDTATGKEMDR